MSGLNDVVNAFSAEHVTTITGLTSRQLSYWDETGFFKPQYAIFGEGRAAIRIYSFRDVVSLRTLNVLKRAHKVSLQHLRAVAEGLAAYSNAPFAELRLTVFNREVHFNEPETGRARSVVSGQYSFLDIIDVMKDVRKSAASLIKRNESQLGKIEQQRNVAHNSRVIAGTRIPVQTIAHFIHDGYSTEQILREYPTLDKMDVESVASDAGLKIAA